VLTLVFIWRTVSCFFLIQPSTTTSSATAPPPPPALAPPAPPPLHHHHLLQLHSSRYLSPADTTFYSCTLPGTCRPPTLQFRYMSCGSMLGDMSLCSCYSLMPSCGCVFFDAHLNVCCKKNNLNFASLSLSLPLINTLLKNTASTWLSCSPLPLRFVRSLARTV
jgi:hypothetical protein